MSSKSELTKTIETQEAQITRLQKRLTGGLFFSSFFFNQNFFFSDIVNAYKNLQIEKNALESTVRVLSSTTAPTTSDNDTNLTAKEVSLFIYFRNFINL
jgi:hypothetical protein